ncbi:MAG TPA: S9 family peptidase, partial [Gemmatimonadaceae bacterium]
MNIRCFAVAAAALLLAAPALAQNNHTPTIDELISLQRAGSPQISPDGRFVVYTVRAANWDDNRYDTQLWLADADNGGVRQLTTAGNANTSPAWSPDGRLIAFASDRDEKRQIFLIDPTGGEAKQLTENDEGIGDFAWSPDGKQIAFTATDPETDAHKEREKKFGEFDVVGAGYTMSHLYVIDVAAKKVRRLTKGDFTVGSFDWSPDGSKIAFDHQVNDTPGAGGSSDISIVTVADGTVRALVTQDGPDGGPVWSPDGSQIAFQTSMANPDFYYTNNLIAEIPAAGGPIVELTGAFDEDAGLVDWTPRGLVFSALSHTWSYLYTLDPQTKRIVKHAPADHWIGSQFSLTRDGTRVAFVASDADSYPEVYVAPLDMVKPKKLTDMAAQTTTFSKGAIEVVSWKSQDGTTIEGVLHKPLGFQEGKRYPLLVVIHGGPTGVSRPTPFSSTGIYPIDIWTAKGALVLEPNYRGSAGYGEAFRSLNVRNLGVGDAWDVLSGIDYLIKEGIADPARVGAMGWSQGGYISAYLTTHDSARFKAISVGAGISDWMTYYVNTDITQFTRHYLKATPWDDPQIYAKTSPITYIKNAKAPTLIQHGATDQRVPPPN